MTPAQTEVLDFVRASLEQTGCAPTMTDIAAHIGMKSKSAAKRLVDQLVSQGLLIRTPYRSRGLALPDTRPLVTVPTRALAAELQRRAAEKLNAPGAAAALSRDQLEWFSWFMTDAAILALHLPAPDPRALHKQFVTSSAAMPSSSGSTK